MAESTESASIATVATDVQRRLSRRQEELRFAIEIPEDHVFLVHFDDGKFDLVAATNNRWPSYLGNNQKMALKRGQTVKFKDRKSPRHTVLGTVITHGPIKIIEKVAEYFDKEKSMGKEVDEMDITMEFASWERLFREEDAAANVREVNEFLRKTSKVQEKLSKERKPNNDNEPDRPEYDAPSTSAPTATATINAPLPSTCDGRCQCVGMQVNMLNRLLENITLFQICLVEQICSKER